MLLHERYLHYTYINMHNMQRTPAVIEGEVSKLRVRAALGAVSSFGFSRRR